MPYRVKKEFLKFEKLTTVLDGKRVALVEAYQHTTKPTAQKPPETINVPLATQAQLKAIFDRGEPCLEKYEEEKPAFFGKSGKPGKEEVKEDEPE